MRFLLALFISLQTVRFPAAASGSFPFDLAPRQAVEARLRYFSNNNRERELILKRMFDDSGCRPPALTEQHVGRDVLPNVICTLAGTANSVIIVGAHFDHVRLGQGVVDNWSGASLLPTIYASLHKASPKHTFVFIAFTDEERGLLGSKYYARHLTSEQLGSIRAMINLDSLGLGSTKVFLNHSDKSLFEKFQRVAQEMQLRVEVVNVRDAEDDSEPFMRRGVPTLMLHSVTPPTWRILHSRRDTLAAINLSAYYDTYRLLATYLAYLDRTLE